MSCLFNNYEELSLFQVITLCERLAGQDANVTTVPVSVLRFTRQLTRFFQWTNDVADRLAFTEASVIWLIILSMYDACYSREH